MHVEKETERDSAPCRSVSCSALCAAPFFFHGTLSKDSQETPTCLDVTDVRPAACQRSGMLRTTEVWPINRTLVKLNSHISPTFTSVFTEVMQTEKKKTAKAVRVITVQVPAEKAVFLPGYTDQWGLEEPSCTTKTNNSVSLKWVTLELKQSGIPIAYILFYIPRTEWKCHVFAKQLKLQLKNVSCGGPQPPEVSQAHNEVALM